MSGNHNKDIETELQALSRGLTHLVLRHIRFSSLYGCGTWDMARKVEK